MVNRHLERNRKYSIVIHDVIVNDEVNPRNPLKDWVILKAPKYYMIALEKYNHQEGYHLHLFIEFKHTLSKFKILRELGRIYNGRIQVDPGRGSRDDCLKYLTDPEKSKDTDTNIINETGIPKIRLHNHTSRDKRVKGCPACEWLKYFRKLCMDLTSNEWKTEDRKPYLDHNGPGSALPADKIKYW